MQIFSLNMTRAKIFLLFDDGNGLNNNKKRGKNWRKEFERYIAMKYGYTENLWLQFFGEIWIW